MRRRVRQKDCPESLVGGGHGRRCVGAGRVRIAITGRRRGRGRRVFRCCCAAGQNAMAAARAYTMGDLLGPPSSSFTADEYQPPPACGGEVPVSGHTTKRSPGELELEVIQSHMAQKPVLRGEVGARVRVIRACGQRRERRYGRAWWCKAPG